MTPARRRCSILTWNRRDDVLRCVASLPRLTYPNVTPVVIDNASPTTRSRRCARAIRELTIIAATPRNLGYAGGNNVGIRWALARGADYVQLINSDTEVTPDARPPSWCGWRESDPRIAVVGCRNLLMEDPTAPVGRLRHAHLRAVPGAQRRRRRARRAAVARRCATSTW